MARILAIFFAKPARHSLTNKFRLCCCVCLLFVVFIAVIKCLSSFLEINVKEDTIHLQLLEQFRLHLNETEHSVFPFVVEATLGEGERKFSNEESRIVGLQFSSNTFTINKWKGLKKTIYLATQFFSEWNPRHYYFPHIGSKTFERYPCPINECVVTKEPKDITKADAVLFHVRDLQVYGIPKFRSENQVWILYSNEPPWLELVDIRRFQGVFNWTMSYRNGSDIMTKYGFIGRRPAPSPDKMATLSEKAFLKKADRAVWYVTNCCTDSRREDYVAELIKFFPVDVLGGCGTEGCRPAETNSCYKKIEKRYKFYLAFENAICQSYVTEKLYNALEYKIIPVVLGGANYNNIVPQNSVINALEFKNPEELAKYLWVVSRNITLYRSYFKWKETYRSYLYPWMCTLCEKLHSDESISAPARRDLVSWWHGAHSCKQWTGTRTKNLDPSMYAMPCYHTKIFV